MEFQKEPISRGQKDGASKLLMTGATDRDLGKQVEGEMPLFLSILHVWPLKLYPSPFSLGRLGLSYVNSLGANSFCETGMSSSLPHIHRYPQFRRKYKAFYFSFLSVLVIRG